MISQAFKFPIGSFGPDKGIAWSVYRKHAVFFGLATALILALGFGAGELSFEGRAALMIFGLAALVWCLTSLDSTYVALVAAISPTVLGLNEPEAFFMMLGDAMLWLLLAAFVVAAAFTKSGLAARLTRSLVRGRTSIGGLFLRLTGVILASALVIPATSGRAAIFLPVFSSLSEAIGNSRIVRALALVIPVLILLSAAASLIGAGAHLVSVEIVARMGGERISYLQWLVWGLPFAAASCLLSAWVVLRLFLSKDERRRTLVLENQETSAVALLVTRDERLVLWVVGALVALWISEPLHGVHAAIVAIFGALVVTAPGLGVLSLKEGMKAVNWSLLIFMAATIELGQLLVDTGAANWLIGKAFVLVAPGTVAAVAMVIAISLLAHLFITSRTARSSILVPMVVLLAASAGVDPLALAFISTIAAGYCLTLPVSAKPLAMFVQWEGVTFAPGDLLRLSVWLIPLHLVLLGLFAGIVWPWLGLDIQAGSSGGTLPLP